MSETTEGPTTERVPPEAIAIAVSRLEMLLANLPVVAENLRRAGAELRMVRTPAIPEITLPRKKPSRSPVGCSATTRLSSTVSRGEGDSAS